MHFKINFSNLNWFTLCCFLCFTAQINAQRIQVQTQLGANFSKAYFQEKEGEFKTLDVSTYFDTLPVQIGLGVKVKVSNKFYLRVDGNYKKYRTYFKVERYATGIPYFVQGNLYNEKFTYSILPEFQHNLKLTEDVKLSIYVFGGPVVSTELGNNYSNNYLIDGGVIYFMGSIKPDPQLGISAGFGVNPKIKRLGFLFEGRLTQFQYLNEDILAGSIRYRHFSLSTGITYDLY